MDDFIHESLGLFYNPDYFFHNQILQRIIRVHKRNGLDGNIAL